MKIIYLCWSLEPTNGWNRYARDVITRIAKQPDVDVTVICEKVDPTIAAGDALIRQIPVLRRPIAYLGQPVWVLLDAWKVRRTVKGEMAKSRRRGDGKKEDVFIHSTLEGYAMFAPFLRGLGAKMLMTTHGTYSVLPLKSARMRWLYTWMYRCLDRVISVSNYTKKHILKNAPGVIAAEKIQVVLNGVDFQEKPPRTAGKDGVFRMMAVGEVKNRKGAHHFVHVAGLLKEKYGFPFQMTFVGRVEKEEQYYKDLIKVLEQHGLVDAVKFPGMVSQAQLDAYYQESDLFVLLSVHEAGHYEGYPLVFHEAAMWGLPSVGTFDCGAEDAVKNGETGVLVHPANHLEVAEVIAKIQSGQIKISPEACKAWAKENDWGKKDLVGMYRF